MNLDSLKSSRSASRLFLTVAIVSAIGMVAGPMIMRGRSRAKSALPVMDEKAVAQLRSDAEGLRQKLDVVQQRALAKNPEISRKQQSLMTAIESRMKAEGIDSQQIEGSLKELRAKVQNPKLSEEQRKQAMAQAMGEMQRFERTRRKVLAEPGIAAQLKSFRGELIAAMTKEDSSVLSLMKKLEEAEAKLQMLIPES